MNAREQAKSAKQAIIAAETVAVGMTRARKSDNAGNEFWRLRAARALALAQEALSDLLDKGSAFGAIDCLQRIIAELEED